jgi:hypothetical protein
MIRSILLTVLLGLGSVVPASADCLDGTYLVVGDPLLSSPGGAFIRDAVTIEDGFVSIASGCPRVQARIRTTLRGKVVRAVWRQCGSLARFVRLRAFVNNRCRIMKGLFTSARPRIARGFVALNQLCHGGPCGGVPCDDVCDCYRGATFEHPCPLLCPICGNYWTCETGVCVEHCGALPGPDPLCEPHLCDGIAGLPCPDGQFCEHPPGTCNVADQGGVCAEVPGACPEVYLPVCGCDGVTYGNDCARRAAKAQKAHGGRCG